MNGNRRNEWYESQKKRKKNKWRCVNKTKERLNSVQITLNNGFHGKITSSTWGFFVFAMNSFMFVRCVDKWKIALTLTFQNFYLSIFTSLKEKKKETITGEYIFFSFFLYRFFFFLFVHLFSGKLANVLFHDTRHCTRQTHLIMFIRLPFLILFFRFSAFSLFDVVRFIYNSVLGQLHTYHFREKLFINWSSAGVRQKVEIFN